MRNKPRQFYSSCKISLNMLRQIKNRYIIIVTLQFVRLITSVFNTKHLGLSVLL